MTISVPTNSVPINSQPDSTLAGTKKLENPQERKLRVWTMMFQIVKFKCTPIFNVLY